MVDTKEIAKEEVMNAILLKIKDLHENIVRLDKRNKIVEHRILIIANNLEELNEYKEMNKRLNSLEGRVQTLSSILMNQRKHGN